MLRSTISTVSASREFIISWLNTHTHPTQPLCTLRVRRRRRLTQHSLPGGLLGLTWAGLAPADRASFAGAFPYSITSSLRSRTKATAKAKPSRSWAVTLIKKGVLLGFVEAPDQKAAELAAAKAFTLSEWQRKRLLVRERI